MSDTSHIPVQDLSPGGLIPQVAGGNESAMTALYDATDHLLFGLVIRIVGDRAAAEEVLLDVYTHVWRRAQEFDQESCDAITWLTKIARTYAIERSRETVQKLSPEQGGDPASLEDAVEFAGVEDAATAVRRELVRSALDTLPSEQRQIIEMAYFSGVSLNEIAGRLRLPLARVRMGARLGMIKLSDLLRSLFDGQG